MYQKIFLQVNNANEVQKSGFSVEQLKQDFAQENASKSLQETLKNEKPLGSSSTVSERTFRSQYQMVNYSISDLTEFVKTNVKNNYR